MNRNLLSLLGILLLLNSSLLFAQSKIVSVNPLTGTANVVIPVDTVKSGQVSMPISLIYYATGIRPKDVEGTAGMGWQLNAGGQISREVRGLPDDVLKDTTKTGNSMPGWMSTANTPASLISNFAIANNGVSCTNENTDYTYMYTHFGYTGDTEPDMFYVNAPGLSCQMVYDRTSAKFHPVSYQDLIITYVNNATTGLITSFTITNDKGIKYVFAAPDSVIQTAKGGSHSYFATKYNQYQHGIFYSDTWGLTSMTDANGNGVILDCSFYTKRRSTDPISLYLPGATTASLQYNLLQSVVPQVVRDIKTINVNGTKLALTFDWESISDIATGEPVISGIAGSGTNKYWNFSYGADISLNNSNNPDTYDRNFLKTYAETGDGCSSIIYKFHYIGEAPGGSNVGGYDLDGDYTTPLPDSSSTQLDYWGYYSTNANASKLTPRVWISNNASGIPRYTIDNPNGNANYPYSTTVGNSRAADPANVMDGSLNKISYTEGSESTDLYTSPTGFQIPTSSINITYESNDYIDVPSGTVIQGGGIRVKQIIDSVGNGSSNNIIRNYSYLNPSTGNSSGKPITLPAFAFTIPYSGTATGSSLWNSNTVLSDYDLSSEDHTIIYNYTKVSQTGAGSTLYQNYNPATYWDNSAVPGCAGCTTAEWAPTINDVARSSCSLVYGPIKNDIYSYPFIPNPNYDFERGLPVSVINYNDAGQEVAETDYSYQRSFAPSAITAFKYEDNPNGSLPEKAYNKYTVYYSTSELTATEVKKLFDSPTLSQAQTSTVNYTYGSPYHKLVTQQSTINSDNSTITTHISYVKDFPAAAAGSNANVNALYQLRQLNINAPVESYQQITRGGTTLTTVAGLTLYNASTNGGITNYLPAQQLKWVQSANSTFTPLAVTATALNDDQGYFATNNFDTYDNTGSLLTADDANKNFQTVITDHISNQPTAVFKNARYNEVAFNDFDSQFSAPVNSFTINGTGAFTPVGSHAGNSAGLATTQTVSSGTVTKNSLASNYIFSIWINATTAGTLSFTGVSVNPISYTAGGWKYYELKIPATALNATFTLGFTTNQPISVDDILLYPDIAEATTTTYDNEEYYKIAETNTNGVSVYYANDEWGRLLLKYDQDKNIIEKKTYVTSDAIAAYNSSNIGISVVQSPTIVNIPIEMYESGYLPADCYLPSYSWDFGDGTIANDINGDEKHTYSTTGTYTVKLTFSTGINTRTVSSVITIVPPPPPPPPLVPVICQSGVYIWYDNGGTPVLRSGCSTTAQPNTSLYGINSVSGNQGTSGNLTFNWQISVNGQNWVPAAASYSLIHVNPTNYNPSQLVVPCTSQSVSYSVRCLVNGSNPTQSGISNVVSFTAH